MSGKENIMDLLRAFNIVDGIEEADWETELQAWQTIYNETLWQHLPGRYGRMIVDLLMSGDIEG